MVGSRLVDKLGPFVAVPNAVFEMTPVIGSDAAFMYCYLRWRTYHETEIAWPGYRRMKADIGWGEHRLLNAIDTLEEHGLIERRKRFGRTTEYTMKPPPVVTTTTGDDASFVGATTQFCRSDNTVLSPRQRNKTDFNKNDATKTKKERGSSSPRQRQPSDHDRIRGEVEKHFATLTNLPLPPRTGQGRSEAIKRWWNPLRSICELVNWVEDDARDLIEFTIKYMDARGLEVEAPASILKTARSVWSKRARGIMAAASTTPGLATLAQALAASKRRQEEQRGPG